MSTPLELAERYLRLEGALVEPSEGVLEAVVPADVATRFGVDELARFSAEERPGARRLNYGTELLERMIAAATARVPVASARAVALQGREVQAAAAAAGFVLRNGVHAAGGVRPLAGERLWVHAAYRQSADDEREGIVGAVVSVGTGTPVEGFDVAVDLEASRPIPLDRDRARRAMAAALRRCRGVVEEESAAFRASVVRRRERDRARLEAYFADLLRELDRRAARGRLDAIAAEDKRTATSRERDAKLEALGARYVVRSEVRPIAAVLVSAPAYGIPVTLRRRKAAREILLEYDCATRALVAPACDGCEGPARCPAACDDAFHLLCEACAPSAQGRIDCPACG